MVDGDIDSVCTWMNVCRNCCFVVFYAYSRFIVHTHRHRHTQALIELAEALGDAHEALSAMQLRRFPICTYVVPVTMAEAAAAAPAAEEGSFNDPTCRICYDEYVHVCSLAPCALSFIRLDVCTVFSFRYEAGVEQRVMPCFHRFHKDCIDTWLKVRASIFYVRTVRYVLCLAKSDVPTLSH